VPSWTSRHLGFQRNKRVVVTGAHLVRGGRASCRVLVLRLVRNLQSPV
jgi:hypothetical protein